MEKDQVILIYVLILITIIAISAYLFICPHGTDLDVDLSLNIKKLVHNFFVTMIY